MKVRLLLNVEIYVDRDKMITNTICIVIIIK